MDGDGSKDHGRMRRGEVLRGDWKETICTDNQQPTQAREIQDSGERSMMAIRGTGKLFDSSVGVEVTRLKFSRDCPLLE